MTNKFHDLFFHVFSSALSIGSQTHITDIPAEITADDTVSVEKFEQLLADNEKLRSQSRILIRQRNYTHDMYELASGSRQRLPDVGPGHIWSEVIRYNPEDGELEINRGVSDGIELGQYVIGHDYLIGTVSKVMGYTSTVKLLTEPGYKILVEVEGKDSDDNDIYIRALMTGGGKGQCRIGEIKTAHKISQGNFVYAYALPGFLNAPMTIGKISTIVYNPDNPLFWDIVVKPNFAPTKLEKVFVVAMEPTVRESN